MFNEPSLFLKFIHPLTLHIPCAERSCFDAGGSGAAMPGRWMTESMRQLLDESLKLHHLSPDLVCVLRVRFQPGLQLLQDRLGIAKERFDLRPHLLF